jgi:hypothetical protein
MRSRGNDNKGNDIGLGNIGEEDLSPQNTTNALSPIPGNTERKVSHQRTVRSDSYITPGLIKNLKKNKKRIIAKGWFYPN